MTKNKLNNNDKKVPKTTTPELPGSNPSPNGVLSTSNTVPVELPLELQEEVPMSIDTVLALRPKQARTASDLSPETIPTKQMKKFRKIRDIAGSGQHYIVPAPKFLIITRQEGDFTTVSPFLIAKTLKSCLGSLAKSVKKVSKGLLVEVDSPDHTARLLQLQTFGDLPVTVTPHDTLNHCKGVVVCRDLLTVSEDEIVTELGHVGVIHCRRLQRLQDGKRIDSASHVLTFNRPSLPSHIYAGIHRLEVRPFVPQPLRCFKCQRFGHTAIKCQREPTCVCGKPTHEGTNCPAELHCVNCGGGHSSRSRNCPIYRQEVTIQELKTSKKLSYMEAKKLIAPLPSSVMSRSYAAAASSASTTPSAAISDIAPLIAEVVQKTIKDLLPSLLISTSPSGMVNPSTTNRATSGPTPNLATTTSTTSKRAEPSSGSIIFRTPPSSQHTSTPCKPLGTVSVTESSAVDSDCSQSSAPEGSNRTQKQSKRGWIKGRPRKRVIPIASSNVA